MADVVNMQQSEYDEAQIRLETLHQEVMEDIRDIMSRIREVCEREGGFYVNQISEKVNTLLDCVEGQILAELKTNYEAERAAIEAFIAAVKGIDIA